MEADMSTIQQMFAERVKNARRLGDTAVRIVQADQERLMAMECADFGTATAREAEIATLKGQLRKKGVTSNDLANL